MNDTYSNYTAVNMDQAPVIIENVLRPDVQSFRLTLQLNSEVGFNAIAKLGLGWLYQDI